MTEIRSALVAKQRILIEDESETSFNSWVQSIMFHLVVDSKFSRFTDQTDLGKWKSVSVNHRGFTDDVAAAENGPKAEVNMSAVQKAAILKVILGSIATFAPIVDSKSITERSLSLDDVFNRLRSHLGFRATGARILELSQFSLGPNEGFNTLWERMSAFIESNLMTKSGQVRHLDMKREDDEVPSPTLQNVTMVLWLKAINPELPMIIKQRFATQLRTNTLYSIREEISDSLRSVLSEMQDRELAVNFARGVKPRRNDRKFDRDRPRFPPTRKKSCCLCKAAGRPGADTHFLSECNFLPSEDKRFMSRSSVREVTGPTDGSGESEYESEANLIQSIPSTPFSQHPVQYNPPALYNTPMQSSYPVQSDPMSQYVSPTTIYASANKVAVYPSPILEAHIPNGVAMITLDSGAEINCIKASECRRRGIPIMPTTQRCKGAECSPLDVVGEVQFECVRGHHTMNFCGVAVNNLNCDILGGMPYHVLNDVYSRPARGHIMISECCRFDSKSDVNTPGVPFVRLCKSTVLRLPARTCLFPGEEIKVPVPPEFIDKPLSIEPRVVSDDPSVPDWVECRTINSCPDGVISIKNSSSEPVLLKKHDHIAQLRHVDSLNKPSIHEVPPLSKSPASTCKPKPPYSDEISIDPDKFYSAEIHDQFRNIHREFDSVFSPGVGKYNGASGYFKHDINMGPGLPPQRRGRNPRYSKVNAELLQAKLDELVSQGVLARPEDIGVDVEYTSPSFLVKKSNGGHRLVTAFCDLSQYCRPQPAAMPNVEDVLRQISQFDVLLKSDLVSSYYQIEMGKESRKYVGIVSPFRGTLVYQRAVMGLPGSEASLECLLSKILGDLMIEGSVVKLADDLYIGGKSVQEVQITWRRVLQLLQRNGLKLSPRKTHVLPSSTVILGWLWERGTIKATPHRLNTLMQCEPPQTVSKLRSFIGSYKALSKVIPRHADNLGNLDMLCATNKPPAEKINWTDSLLETFKNAKLHLQSAKTLTLPKREDLLQIFTDASGVGLAGVMYCIRDGKPYLAGLFNAKRRPHQVGWLPCELEALAILSSVKYFSPYINQSQQKTTIMTDSLPCVKAFQKFARGEFSASPRVATFISTLSHYPGITLAHVPGKNNLLADFASRHPIQCDGSCQICTFINDSETSVVQSISFTDVIEGRSPVPYSNRSTWHSLQQDCRALRKTATLLSSGGSLGKKERGMKDVKRYLMVSKLSSNPADGLIVVSQSRPLQPDKQLIVVPRGIIDGLLTAIHLQLSHPSKEQLKQIFSRTFYALDLDHSVETVVKSCHVCVSLKKIPSRYTQQSTSEPPTAIGIKFSADVVKENLQKILLMREYTSSYTDATFIDSEKAQDIKSGIVKIVSRLCSPNGPQIIIRVDPAPGFQSLLKDPLLASLPVQLEIGESKNINKNPVSERAISEFHEESAKLQPCGGPISETLLSLIVQKMNSRIRGFGLSALEILTKRDMTSGDPIKVDDQDIINHKQAERQRNHHPSAKYKSRGNTIPQPDVKRGDIVYIISDRVKGQCRDRYLVTELIDPYAYVQKLLDTQFRAKKYKVRISELLVVPRLPSLAPDSDESSDEITITLSSHQAPATLHEGEQIPAPQSGDETYPCSVCSEEVGEEEDSLQCDECLLWCHRSCSEIEGDYYLLLKEMEHFQWTCPVHATAKAASSRPSRSKKPVLRFGLQS